MTLATMALPIRKGPMRRGIGSQVLIVFALFGSTLFAACSSVDEFIPKRSLTTSAGTEVLMANECGTGSYGSLYFLSFNQLAVRTPQDVRRPLVFDYRKQGRTNGETREGLRLLGNYSPLMMRACERFRLGANAEYRSRALEVADRAVILAVEAGLRLERATTSEEFARILEEENRRKHELYESAGELSPYYFMLHN